MEMNIFPLCKCDAFWRIIEQKAIAQCERGQGRKYESNRKHVIPMGPSVLKHGGSWYFNGQMFGIKGPIFERMITGLVNIICPLLFEEAVQKF